MHRLLVEYPDLRPGETLVIEGDEAAHALRVKRLGPDDTVEILNGQGLIATATVVAEPGKRPSRDATLRLRLSVVRRVRPVRPALHVLTATPKGPRVDEMIQQLAQVGAASWAPLSTSRGVVDPRDTKLARLQRIAGEASKQCGRAWALNLEPPISFAQAVQPLASTAVVVADAGGGAASDFDARAFDSVRLLIGPEGGFTPEELGLARPAGAVVLRLGPHIMRIETAAVVAAGILLACSTWNSEPT